ncbi:MAG: EndoU domain-containing protein [Alphaproteobacteria bacterium]
MHRLRQGNILKYLILAFLIFALIEAIVSSDQSASYTNKAGFLHPPPSLNAKAKQHILYGNETGGGHKHGQNKPCKSEFPFSWNDEKIINIVKDIAANDNTQWNKQNNGYYVTEQNYESINVRVVIGKQQKQIITAYPTNVKRNPCP